MTVGDGDVFLVPRGYHGPCVAAPGYPLYYLNVMAGPATERRMAIVDDPRHGWIRDTWSGHDTDPRCPMTTAKGPTWKTVQLTTAQAIVRFLVAQRTVVDGEEVPLFPGVFAIFGHGNVLGLGNALHEARDVLPTYRGQNEQGMALAAVAFAKATRRRQIMVATSSIGPGATNMVTAAGVAHANRLPLLLLAGDTFQSRIPDPVLQQVEHFGQPSTTVNDAFRAVTRYWDRIVRPEQVAQSLPLAIETMLDPADCGPAFIGLPQDVQAEAYDYPVRLFEPRPRAAPAATRPAPARGGCGDAPRRRAARSWSPAAASTTRSPRRSCARSSRRTASRSSRPSRASRA